MVAACENGKHLAFILATLEQDPNLRINLDLYSYIKGLLLLLLKPIHLPINPTIDPPRLG